MVEASLFEPIYVPEKATNSVRAPFYYQITETMSKAHSFSKRTG